VENITIQSPTTGTVTQGGIAIGGGTGLSRMDGCKVNNIKFKLGTALLDLSNRALLYVYGTGDVSNVYCEGGKIPNVGNDATILDYANGALFLLLPKAVNGEGQLTFRDSTITGLAESGTPSGNSALRIVATCTSTITSTHEKFIMRGVDIDAIGLSYFDPNNQRHMIEVKSRAEISGCRFVGGSFYAMFQLWTGSSPLQDINFHHNSIWLDTADNVTRLIYCTGSGHAIIQGNVIDCAGLRDSGLLIATISCTHPVISGNSINVWSQPSRTTAPLMFYNSSVYLAVIGNSVLRSSLMGLYTDVGSGTTPSFGSFGTYNAYRVV